MNKKIKTEAVDHLFDAILTLKDSEECYKFFEDVCTINELLSLSQRYEVAKMLREGKTYLEIAEKTGVSAGCQSHVYQQNRRGYRPCPFRYLYPSQPDCLHGRYSDIRPAQHSLRTHRYVQLRCKKA